MLVIPAVDIRNGKCVQLVGGEPGTDRYYGDPVEAAINWEERGAECVHVIDLDAAMGEGDNLEKVAEILANLTIEVQVGGGIRSTERAFELLGIGADRIIIGTAAFKSPEILGEIVKKSSPESVIVAMDVKEGEIAVEGWKEKTGKDLFETAKEFERKGIGGLLFTNIDVEGKMTGLDIKTLEKLIDIIDIPVIAAGGVKSLEDVKDARDVGASGLVIGTALYEEKVSLEEAMEVS